MKPTEEKFVEAVHAMGLLIPFFPKDDIAQAIIARHLSSFVNTETELQWLTAAACGSIRDWERNGGLPELRGLFCTQFTPADGVAAYCTTPGYRASDLEAQFFAKELEDNNRRYEEFRQLAGSDAKPFPLPKPKLIQ